MDLVISGTGGFYKSASVTKLLEMARRYRVVDPAIRIVKPGGNARLFTIAPTRHPLSIGDALIKGVNFVGRKVTIEKTKDLLELAQRWVAEGRYPIHRTITHHIPLEDVEHGLKFVQEHPEEAIKVVIDT